MKDYNKFLREFNKKFAVFIRNKIKNSSSYSRFLPVNETYKYIEEISENGKRLRPYLAHLSFKPTKKTEGSFQLLFAIELLHIFCLIHDDIIDKSGKRHGIPTANKKFAEIYKDEHFGNSIALLLGDIVFLWCVETINQLPPNTKNRQIIIDNFYLNIDMVIYGQSLDVMLVKIKKIDKNMVDKKMNLKTSNYSFYYPMLLGFLLGGRDYRKNKNLKAVAYNLGAGFQIKDDLLDCDIDNQKNKSSFLDIESGQHTLMSWYITSIASKNHKYEFEKIFNKGKIQKKDYNKVRRLLNISGATKYCEDAAKKHFALARKHLNLLQIEDKFLWLELISHIETRTK